LLCILWLREIIDEKSKGPQECTRLEKSDKNLIFVPEILCDPDGALLSTPLGEEKTFLY